MNNKEKIQCLITLYIESHKEMMRHRDMEWKILSYTTALLIGISTVTRLKPFPDQHLPYIRTILIIFTMFGTYCFMVVFSNCFGMLYSLFCLHIINIDTNKFFYLDSIISISLVGRATDHQSWGMNDNCTINKVL